MKKLIILLFIVFSVRSYSQESLQVRGWNILSDYKEDDLATLKAAASYKINHLQLSHDVVMDLNEIRDPVRQKLVNELVAAAHNAGIKEVVLWDHALYSLKYYPEEFRTGPNGTIDLDNPGFWSWFRQDYRDMLKLAPEADGIVLTFIETGARAENQYSAAMKSPAEKLAKVIDEVAEVVCEEQHKKLYIRTFAYTDREYQNTIGCIGHVKSDKIILMMKETPHDFFLTHPNDTYAGTINRPTIIEFDACNEFNGQGVVANTWPEYIIRRWSDLIKRNNVIGYVARTDRYRDTRLVGTPNEILLYTLKRYSEDSHITAGLVYDEFISAKYGKEAVKYLKPAFMKAYNIVTSSFYTLGTNVANHSKLDYDPYKSSYGRHVSGKWLDPPVVYVKHDVNRQLHYWTDIIDHISPPPLKASGGPLKEEAPFVIEKGWVTPFEKMDENYLRLIVAEKQYGVRQAGSALDLIRKSEKVLKPEDYGQLYGLFTRTLITAKAYEAAATAYFGYRVYTRGEEFRSGWLIKTMKKAIDSLPVIADEIDNYKEKVPRGQWNWRGDAATLREYH
ncbi:MAG TPA: hypothetical protein VK155_01425, partial [Bacteroidales bacterium]|nr:hypothetical protein [Bacteroidales bacterium]